MIQILRILPGNMAIVSTEGLRRVVVPSTGEIFSELATEGEPVARNQRRRNQLQAA